MIEEKLQKRNVIKMKSNFFKYVFAIFVICIMVFAVYKIKTEEKGVLG